MAKKTGKGLFSNTLPEDQPEGTKRFGKNGIQDYQNGSEFNEPGFSVQDAVLPYKLNGVIETDTKPVLFSTDNKNSAIGFFDPETGAYEPILDDSELDFLMRFNLDSYITGEYQKNAQGEYIIVFTDNTVAGLRYLNTAHPEQITKATDLLFFLRATAPKITLSVDSGGQLAKGSYILYVKYGKIDGSQTTYLAGSSPIAISGADGSGTTDKAIRINLSGVDTSYDFVIIGIIRKIDGVTSAEELDPVSVSSDMSIIYTGIGTSTAATPEEILIQPAIYNRVAAITQLNDELFLGGLYSAPGINFQKYASLISVRWTSKEVDMNSVPAEVLNGLEKGFAHGETIALYIRLRLKDGSRTKAFTIAGPSAAAGENNTITVSGVTGRMYQLQDTVKNINVTQRSGATGTWINQDERYPDTEDFDSTVFGGENLRGQPVRHHRMPTHRWIRQNFNANDPSYGRSKLDMLGLQFSNIIIPNEILDRIDGYEILFAKRTTGNSTVFGQSEVLYAAQSYQLLLANTQNNFQSTAGNFNSVPELSGPRDVFNVKSGSMVLRTDRVRMHPFELLFNRPELPQNCYLQFEWKMRIDTTKLIVSFSVSTDIEPDDREDSDIKPVVYLLDYKGQPSVITTVSDADRLRKLNNLQYAPNNVNGGEWNNTQVETSVVGTLSTSGPSIAVGEQHVAVTHSSMKDLRKENYLRFEETFLATIRVLRDNVYNSFLSQSLVSTGRTFPAGQTSTDVIYAGDTFVCEYTYHTYGWVSNDNGATTAGNQAVAGTKTVRRIVCESIANINQRYEVPGNIYSKWFPHNVVAYQNAYIMDFDRSLDPNQFGYSKDLNALNDLESIAIFSPFLREINDFPNRIHRGGKFQRTGYVKSWRTLLPLDYYDVRRDRGIIINLQGYDDALLVHLEAALLVTQDKTTLKGDILSVTLGTAEIFQYAPLETISTALGFGGTRHKLACRVTPIGYMFCDTVTGQVFVFKGELKLLNAGLNVFFKEYLRLAEVNPFSGNGITIGYDPDYNRALLTVKNIMLLNPTDIKPGFELTQEYFNTLVSGDIVNNTGTLMVFRGLNTTEFDCPQPTSGPTILPAMFNIPENSPVGTILGTITATGIGITLIIISGNTGSAFTINSANQLVVNNPVLNYEVKSTYNLIVRVIDNMNRTADAAVIVNILNVNEPPVIGNYETSIPENTVNGSEVITVTATDPEGTGLTYSILSGNDLGAFAINSATGVITVADTTKLDYETIQQFLLKVQVSDGTLTGTGNVVINIIDVDESPQGAGASGSVNITDPVGTVVLQGTPAINHGNTDQPLTYTLLSESSPGKFSIGLDQNDAANFLKIRVATSPVIGNYTMTVRASDDDRPGKYVDLIYSITVQEVPKATLIFTSNEQFDPSYADVNQQTKADGVVISNIYGTGTDSAEVYQGVELFAEAYNDYKPLASNAVMFFTVKRNGVVIYTDTRNYTGQIVNMTWPGEAAIANATYEIITSSVSDAGQAFTIINGLDDEDTDGLTYKIYADSVQPDNNPLSTGAFLVGNSLNLNALISGQQVIRFFWGANPTTVSYRLRLDPVNTTEGPFSRVAGGRLDDAIVSVNRRDNWKRTGGGSVTLITEPTPPNPGTLSRGVFWDNSKLAILAGQLVLTIRDNTNNIIVGTCHNPDTSDTDTSQNINYMVVPDGNTVSLSFKNNNTTTYADVNVTNNSTYDQTQRILPGETKVFTIPKINVLINLLAT